MESAVEKRDARLYELAVLTVGVTDAIAFSPAIELIKKEGPKSVSLGYPIRKHESAFLTVYVVSAVPEDIAAIKEAVHTNAAVLRHILITPPVATRRRAARVEKSETREEARPASPEAVSNAALEAALETIQGTNESR